MGFPQLDASTYPSQIFWLFVCVLCLFGFVKTVFIPRVVGILETREKRIQGDKDKAESVVLSTQKIQREMEEQILENRQRARHQREVQMQEFSQRRQEKLDRLQRGFERKCHLLEKEELVFPVERPDFVDLLLQRGQQ